MSSPCHEPSRRRWRRGAAVVAAALAAVACANVAPAAQRVLRVCAEPDNMPLSDAHGAGFENRIAELIASGLEAQLAYDWQPQRRAFVRKTIGADLCDVWIGVPDGFARLLTSRPYYRSGYVMLTRAEAGAPPRSLADPRLQSLRIGVQLIGNDLAATPPGLALARAGALEGVVGYPVYGEGSAAERITADLAAGRLDAAIVWGPQAGWFARRATTPLALTRISAPEGFELPFEFAISVGVRKSMPALRDEIDAVLAQHASEVGEILDAYHVPRLAAGDAALARSSTGGSR